MSGIVAINFEQVAHTRQRINHVADDIRATAQDLVSCVLPISHLAAPFSNALSNLLQNAAVTVGDVVSWAEKAETDVRSTVKDIADADAEAEELSSRLGKLMDGKQALDHRGTRR